MAGRAAGLFVFSFASFLVKADKGEMVRAALSNGTITRTITRAMDGIENVAVATFKARC